MVQDPDPKQPKTRRRKSRAYDPEQVCELLRLFLDDNKPSRNVSGN